MTASGPGIVVSGALLQKPYQGGYAWVLLHYLGGFRRLGFPVTFLDRSLSGEPVSPALLRRLRSTMETLDLAKDFAVLSEDGDSLGLSFEEVLRRCRDASFLLNVMGFLTDERILDVAGRRVFLDIDPGFPQMWKELGLADVFAGHDTFVTIGENIGGKGCEIPTCGLEWITTKQPILLDQWPVQTGRGKAFTTVASWRGAYGPIEYRGKTYGLRVHEFRKLAGLPRLSTTPFELALDIHADEVSDLGLLERNGWTLIDPKEVAGDAPSYRSFVQSSKAEFGVAKNMYVETKGGWFSDRSICYLASGRPVLVQDTGIRDIYSTEEGLLVFSTIEEAAAGVEDIERNYQKHSRAAREIAKEHFDSDTVLTRLVAKLELD